MERDLQYLLDMLQSAKIVMNYIAGRSREELATDLQFQDATIRRLSIVGEAAKRICETTRNKYRSRTAESQHAPGPIAIVAYE